MTLGKIDGGKQDTYTAFLHMRGLIAQFKMLILMRSLYQFLRMCIMNI